jgi:hypothetical protein
MDFDDVLAERGRAVYEALIKGRPVDAIHRAQCLNVARMADTLDRIDAEFQLDPRLTVINGQGTETANPLISEHRQLLSAFTTILAKMGISELPEASSGEKSSHDQLAVKRAERLAAKRNSGTKDLASPGS